MKQPLKVTCGAKNRQGEPCKKPPMKGKSRCRNHGGKTPTGTKGNRTHGLYSVALSEEERELWDEMKLGTVDDEIRLCRIQLRRAMNLDAQIQKAPNDVKNLAGVELVEIRRSTGAEKKSTTDAVSKRPDVHGRMNWLIGRIAQLEKTRAELIAASRVVDDDPDAHARRIIEAVAAMNEVEFGEYWDDGPDEERQARAIAKSQQRRAREGNGEG